MDDTLRQRCSRPGMACGYSASPSVCRVGSVVCKISLSTEVA
jgi:hypothetical protein